MTDKEKEPPTLPAVLWNLAGLIFKREALLVFVTCCVLVGLGSAGAVWAQSKLDGGVAPLAKRQDELEAQVKADRHAAQSEAEDLRRRMANVERSSYETALNVRLLLEQQKITPIDLDLRIPVTHGQDAGR